MPSCAEALSPQPRQCRASCRRTIGTVRRALNTWCRCYRKERIIFEPNYNSCSELSASVKELLAECPSSNEEERFAYQSIKKLLPDSCRCMNESLLDRLLEGVVRPPRDLPHGFLKFVERQAGKIFPDAWDCTYRNHCFTTSPPLSSTLETSRAKGGGMMSARWHADFLDQVLGTSHPGSTSRTARPMVVQSAGKPRPLTKFSEDCLILKPLHKALYDRISALGWVCRGDVNADKLDRAGFKRGLGSLVSGDYKSATDNLPLEVAECVLRVALRRATRVPEGISKYAMELLRPLFTHCGEEFEVSSGQQMGSLLSFPLLCIQNYIAFMWAKRRYYGKDPPHMPVLINGDDILFQCRDPAFYSSWVQVVGDVGLEVERTKTSVAEDFGSLNSTLLNWKSGSLRVVPTLRFGMLRPQPYANSLPRLLKQFAQPGLPIDVRYVAGVEFVRWHLKTILRTNLTPQELGFSGRFAWRVLHKGGALASVKRRLQLNPRDDLARPLPSLPTLHNVVLTSDIVEWVDSPLTAEEEQMVARELAAWKWSKVGTFKADTRALELRYWLGLSLPAVDVARSLRLDDQGWKGTDWYRRVKTAYFEARKEEPKKYLFVKGIDRLPSYDESIRQSGNFLVEAAPFEAMDKSSVSERKQIRHLELLSALNGVECERHDTAVSCRAPELIAR